MIKENEVVLDFLRLEAIRLQHFIFETPCTSSVPSEIDPLPHQMVAVKKMLMEDPIRVLLADDVGLGKTIMMGMLIKELKNRERISNVLIICPKSLLFQWEREMKEKFDLDFSIISSTSSASKIGDGNFIISMGLLSKKKAVESLMKRKWDLIIVDEAHNLTVQEGKSKVNKTKRYAGAERLLLNDPTTNIVLLSATPHHGKKKDFIHRLRLVDPFVTEESVREVVSNVMIRRLREEVTDSQGNRLVPDRESKRIEVNLSEEERNFFSKVNDYIRDYYKASEREKNRKKSKAYALVATVVQKRASSSIYSLLQTLKKRKEKLSKVKDEINSVAELIDERRIVEQVTISKNSKELSEEIYRLSSLVEEGERIRVDSKLNTVEKIVNEHVNNGEKVIVFTEYRDTLFYLEKKWNGKFRISTVHGGMTVEERKKAENQFVNSSDVLIATNVASEGLNLQVANVIVNYDLPWNPTRLDQRIGRVHRYGQKKKVLVYNIFTRETIDSHVLDILMEKLEVIRGTLGKVFDYLGVAISDTEVEKLIKEATMGKKVEGKVEKMIERTRKVAEAWNDMNLSSSGEVENPCDEEEIVTEEEIEMFVTEALNAMGVPPQHDKNSRLYNIRPPKGLSDHPEHLIIPNASFRFNECRMIPKCNYVYPSHPLVKALIQNLLNYDSTLNFIAENKRYLGWFLLFEITGETDEIPVNGKVMEGNFFKKSLRQRKLVSLVYDEVNGRVVRVPTSFVNCLTAVIGASTQDHLVISEHDRVKEKIRNVEEEVKRNLEIRKGNLKNEVTSVISSEILKSINGKDKSKIEELWDRSKAIEDLFDNAGIYTESRLLAAVKLIPHGFSEITGNVDIDSMKEFLSQGTDGEEIVKKVEERKGCTVKDMRDVFTAGFDFLSICKDEVKYIEVKTVKGDQSRVNITPVELMAMDPRNKRYRERFTKVDLDRDDVREHFYLYVVDLKGKNIWEIKNPAATLSEFLYQQRYTKIQRKVEIPYQELQRFLRNSKVQSESF